MPPPACARVSDVAAMPEEDFLEHRHEDAGGKADDELNDTEAHGGAVCAQRLDHMSSEALGDVVHAVEEEVEHMKHDIEDERKKVEAMKDNATSDDEPLRPWSKAPSTERPCSYST